MAYFGQSNRVWAPWVVLAITIGVVVFGALAKFGPVNVKPITGGEVGSVLLSVIFFALVVERAVEVYINNQFGHEELVKRRNIRLAKNRILALEETLNHDAARPATSESEGRSHASRLDWVEQTREKLRAAQDDLAIAESAAQSDLENLRVRKAATAGAVSVLISVLVAAAGVRVFANFIKMEDGAYTWPLEGIDHQLAVFLSADILVTALLLAGGADGIHQIIKRFLVIEKDVTG